MIKGFLTVCYAVLTSTVACASMTSEDLSFVASLDGTTQKYLKLTHANLPSEKIDVMIWLHGHGCDRLKVLESRGECSGSRDFCEQSGMLLVSPDYRAQTSWMGPAAEADTLQPPELPWTVLFRNFMKSFFPPLQRSPAFPWSQRHDRYSDR